MAEAGEDRAKRRASLAEARTKAPAANPDEVKERNQKALEARKARLAAMKEAETKRELPPGWRMVESRSRPGEFVYENIHTEERQAWFPESVAPEEVSAPLVAMSEDQKKKEALKAKNQAALEKRKQAMQVQKAAEKDLPLPDGWKRVESRSRPGEMVYENTVTGERQAWFPDAPAAAASADDAKKKEMMEKNKAALEKRKQAMAAKQSDDATKPLPEGWRRVESRSRPGEFVYENIYTEERQAWWPEGPAEKPLPAGWRKVESRTYPGEFVYENVHTLERQAWLPTEPAPTEEAQAKPPPQAAAAAKAPAAIVAKAKAMYDYTAINREEEIDLLEGDMISVEYKAANGWWVGKNERTQRSGIFPGTYVEEVR